MANNAGDNAALEFRPIGYKRMWVMSLALCDICPWPCLRTGFNHIFSPNKVQGFLSLTNGLNAVVIVLEWRSRQSDYHNVRIAYGVTNDHLLQIHVASNFKGKLDPNRIFTLQLFFQRMYCYTLMNHTVQHTCPGCSRKRHVLG